MKFRDNHSRDSSRVTPVIVTMIVSMLACNLPLTVQQAALPTPEPIVWWTNTPEPVREVTPEATPEPTATQVELPTATLPPTATPPLDAVVIDNAPYLYNAMSGDSIDNLAVRFSVLPEEITSPDPFSTTGPLRPGQLFLIPRRLANTTSPVQLIPDSDVVHSPSAALFDVEDYVANAGGYLSTYREYLSTGWTSGADIISRIGLENSINPRVLLTLLEFQAGWVLGDPPSDTLEKYPMGLIDSNRDGLYEQMSWAISQLSIGYYGWREGLLTDIIFTDGAHTRLAPDLNAGTVGVMYYLAQVNDSTDWLAATDPDTGFAALHTALFGNAWDRAAVFEPLFPTVFEQPEMILPFELGSTWSYSGGPHGAWGRLGARAAIDFAPSSQEPGCVPSDEQVTAAAPGVIVRTGTGVLVLDLDGDGNESTGWVLLYLHIATEGKIDTGTWVTTGQYLGFPSCEGGFATGTHIHIARKFNGEWVSAGGPVPFVLDGWTVGAGAAPYEGTLTRDGVTIKASPLGTASTRVTREH